MSKCRTAFRFPGGPAGSNPWISRSIWFVPRKVLNTSAIADVIVPCAAGVFRVVGRGQERPPARLLDCRRITVVVARYRAEAVGGDRGGVDRCDRPPEQVVVLGITRWTSGHRRRRG